MQKRKIPRLSQEGTGAKVERHQRISPAGRQSRAGEPWRSEYSHSDYRQARQEAIERYKGRCRYCGAVVFVKVDGKWRSRGGEVHHDQALSDGGTNDPAHLVPCCIPCHRRVDAARRASGGGTHG